MEKRIKDKVGEDGTKGRLFLDTLRSNIPAMMLCCIPLFAFVLKILYIRKRRFYVEHLGLRASHPHLSLRGRDRDRAARDGSQPIAAGA